MKGLRRTHTCGELGRTHAGAEVVLNGWVDAVRDLGGLTFLQLRDRYGSCQVVLSEQADASGAFSPADIRAVQLLNRLFCGLLGCHFDKAEPLRPTGVPVGDDLRRGHLAVR